MSPKNFLHTPQNEPVHFLNKQTITRMDRSAKRLSIIKTTKINKQWRSWAPPPPPLSYWCHTNRHECSGVIPFNTVIIITRTVRTDLCINVNAATTAAGVSPPPINKCKTKLRRKNARNTCAVCFLDVLGVTWEFERERRETAVFLYDYDCLLYICTVQRSGGLDPQMANYSWKWLTDAKHSTEVDKVKESIIIKRGG